MSKGFLWFVQNNDKTDYVKLSIELAKSIKKHNVHNNICIVTDKNSKTSNKIFDHIVVLENDESINQSQKFSNEYKAFSLTPFTHTIKLEADMLWTSNTDWWWYYLNQHNMIFSINCRNFCDDIVTSTPYRKLFEKNHLPDVYNGMCYFRKSKESQHFFNTCKLISQNWNIVKEELLINCHDEYPSTDVVYGLALRIIDPTVSTLIDYPWFKFIHNKPRVNRVDIAHDQTNYLYPVRLKDRIYLGGQRINRVWHYYEKDTVEKLNDRIF